MDGLQAAIQALSGICQRPEQAEFLAYLASQPPEVASSVMQTYASRIDPAAIPSLVDSEFPQLPPEMRALLATQALEAYNFLKTQ